MRRGDAQRGDVRERHGPVEDAAVCDGRLSLAPSLLLFLFILIFITRCPLLQSYGACLAILSSSFINANGCFAFEQILFVVFVLARALCSLFLPFLLNAADAAPPLYGIGEEELPDP